LPDRFDELGERVWGDAWLSALAAFPSVAAFPSLAAFTAFARITARPARGALSLSSERDACSLRRLRQSLSPGAIVRQAVRSGQSVNTTARTTRLQVFTATGCSSIDRRGSVLLD